MISRLLNTYRLNRALAKRKAARPARHDAAILGQRTYYARQRAIDPIVKEMAQ